MVDDEFPFFKFLCTLVRISPMVILAFLIQAILGPVHLSLPIGVGLILLGTLMNFIGIVIMYRNGAPPIDRIGLREQFFRYIRLDTSCPNIATDILSKVLSTVGLTLGCFAVIGISVASRTVMVGNTLN